MILALDIGNSNIVIGCIDEQKTYFVERLSTKDERTALEYAINFKNVLEIYKLSPNDMEGGIISSVVPAVSNLVQQSLEIILNKKILLVGPGVKTGLNIHIDNPSTLGSDLVVDAVATIHEYPLPAIVIDMGTATTISVIDKHGTYQGTSIIAGLKVALETLASRAAQLPSIGLDSPKEVIGRNTVDSMKSGAIYGNAALLDGMIDRIIQEMGPMKTIVATGGLSQLILPHCKHSIIYDDTLLLKGLHIIYKKNQI